MKAILQTIRLAICLSAMFGLCLVQFSFAQPGNEKGRPQVGIRYFHTDHIGSSTLTTDQHGNVISQFEYLPFGEVLAASSSGPDDIRAKFTGKERDHDTGLYYFGARYYDPQAGRFISADQGLGAGASHPAALNRYAYAGGNPITVTDPTGNRLQEDAGNVYVPPALPPDAGNLPEGPGQVYLPPALPADAGNLPEHAGHVQDEDGVVATQGQFEFALVPGTDPGTAQPAAADPLALDAAITQAVSEALANNPHLSFVELQVEASVLPGVDAGYTLAIDENGEVAKSAYTGGSVGASHYVGLGGGGSAALKVDQEGNLYLEYVVEAGIGAGTEVKNIGLQICVACVEVKYIAYMDGTSRVEIEPKASITIGNVTLKAGHVLGFDMGTPGFHSPEFARFEQGYFETFWRAGCAPTFHDRVKVYDTFRRGYVPPSRDGPVSPDLYLHQNQELNPNTGYPTSNHIDPFPSNQNEQ